MIDFRSNALSCFEASASMKKKAVAFCGHGFNQRKSLFLNKYYEIDSTF